MDWDDVAPKPKKSAAVGDSLAALSVGELEERVKTFEEEIARIRAEIQKKRDHEAAAQAIFKR